MVIDDEVKLLSVKDVCEILGVSKNFALRLIRTSIPHLRIGNRIKIRQSDLHEYIEDNVLM